MTILTQREMQEYINMVCLKYVEDHGGEVTLKISEMKKSYT